MEVLSAEQIVTISVMCLWFLFPVGMFLSVWRQEQYEKANSTALNCTSIHPFRVRKIHNGWILRNQCLCGLS